MAVEGRPRLGAAVLRVLNVELSLPIFPAGARGLYPLARGCRIRPARGMAPALMVGWIAGGAGFFLVFCRAAPSSYRVDRGRHLAASTFAGVARSPSLSPTRAREALMMAGAGGAMRATGRRATAIRFQQFGEGGPRSPSLSPTRAREALMMAGAGGAMRATGRRATAIRFQQFGEGARVYHFSHPLARARR